MGFFLTKEEKKILGLDSPKLKKRTVQTLAVAAGLGAVFMAAGCGNTADNKQYQNAETTRIEQQVDYDVERGL